MLVKVSVFSASEQHVRKEASTVVIADTKRDL